MPCNLSILNLKVGDALVAGSWQLRENSYMRNDLPCSDQAESAQQNVILHDHIFQVKFVMKRKKAQYGKLKNNAS